MNDGQKTQRPPYIHQIPLEFIPGLGPKMREKLLNHFGTEMAILHEVSFEHLKEVVPEKMAELVVLARTGELELPLVAVVNMEKLNRIRSFFESINSVNRVIDSHLLHTM